MKRTLSLLVNDHPGVLSRVAGLFTRRNYNIESLTVGAAEEPGISRMTIATFADDSMLEQIIKQVDKLIDVIHVEYIEDHAVVERELILIKINSSANTKNEIAGILGKFQTNIVDETDGTLIIQGTGDGMANDELIGSLRPYGILQIARTGVTALDRGQLIDA